MTRYPILFLNDAGETVADPRDGSPFLQVVITFDHGFGWGLGPRNVNGRSALALVDTGAGLVHADPSLIAKNRLPQVNTATVRGATSTIASTAHVGHIFMPGSSRITECDVISTPLMAQRRFFSLILGVRFLATGTLHLD